MIDKHPIPCVMMRHLATHYKKTFGSLGMVKYTVAEFIAKFFNKIMRSATKNLACFQAQLGTVLSKKDATVQPYN